MLHGKFNLFVIILLAIMAQGQATVENKARYDNYRLYRVTFDTEEQVKIFQELEAQSDSCVFIGHAREIGQKLSILVAAHKIADLTDLVTRYNVEHTILVISEMSFCILKKIYSSIFRFKTSKSLSMLNGKK